MRTILNKIILLFSLLHCSFLFAQLDTLADPMVQELNKRRYESDTCHIIVLADVQKDSIVLRWAPDHALTWQNNLQVGFFIDKVIVDKNDAESQLKFERVNTVPFIPLPYAEWAKQFKPKDKYAGIAAQMMYKQSNFSNNDISDPDNISDRSNDLKMRHSFALMAADQDARVASASGLRYVDKDVKPGRGILYRIYYSVANENLPCDTALLYVDCDEISPTYQVRTPVVEEGEKAITLIWNSPKAAGFGGFFIERAEFGTNKFIRLNDAPFVDFKQINSKDLTTYTDSVENYKKYTYRVFGINAFGKLSKPSEEVSGMARDLTPPSPPLILKATDIGNQEIKLEWMFQNMSADLKEIYVGRGANVDGPFEAISESLPKNTLSFIDKSPNPHMGSFYSVFVKDTAGNFARSLPFYGILVDSFPPAIPKGLSGYIDTNSVVHLKWNKGTEPDLQGYRVYFSNSTDHEPSNLTPNILADTTFRDTIQKRTLTKYIYYRLSAVDNNYNHSKPSPWVKIRRLDVIPPDPPIFKHVEVQDSSVHLAWHNSSSDDVAEHLLLRKLPKDTVWKTLAKWYAYPENTLYIDKDVAPKTYYEYAMAAIDSSNLRSQNSPLVSVRTYDRGIRPSVESLSVSYDEKLKANVIDWNYSAQGKYSFLLYRGYQNYGISKYVKIESADRNYIDRDLVGKGDYTYAIKAVYEDGGESPISEKVNVIIE
jgi:fibronectin type 3 domain-containing protein